MARAEGRIRVTSRSSRKTRPDDGLRSPHATVDLDEAGVLVVVRDDLGDQVRQVQVRVARQVFAGEILAALEEGVQQALLAGK